MKKFWSGFLLYMALDNLMMKFIGYDDYVNYLKVNWQSPYETIPIACALLVVSYVLYKS